MMTHINNHSFVRFQNYFRDGWNMFDFLIVLMTLVGAVINTFAKSVSHFEYITMS